MTNNQQTIRQNLMKFIEEHRDFNYEKGESQQFWADFFNCFGIPANVRRVWFEHGIDRKFIDVFYPKHFIIEQKSEGRNLDEAYSQALDYASRLAQDKMPMFIIVSDFKQFRVKNLSTNEIFESTYDDLENYISLWQQILGEKKNFTEEIIVNIEAGNIMADLHDSLKASGYVGDDLEMLLVRLLFCLFADDTGIFDKDIFKEEIDNTDAKYLGSHLNALFNVMNQDPKDRLQTLDESLSKFPYVNGGLFARPLADVHVNEEIKILLVKACNFDWSKISPIIFGSIFQHAMDEKERRNFGTHFTTIENIKKVIDPLFLNGLWSEYEHILLNAKAQKKTTDLQKLMLKIGDLVIFDPACGCGNFLSVAYTELRKLENEILFQTYKQGNFNNIANLILVKISNFYGIEIDEFSSYVARVSMWLTEQQMFIDLSKRFGTYEAKLPLDDEAHIVCANSLRVDWAEVLEGREPHYIVGNPPFVGKQFQSNEQKADIAMIFATNKKAKSLDYVTCWHKKATNFLKTSHGNHTQCAFVSTNSICQGEQTSILWKELFADGVKINFAHQTFKWTTEIKGGAAVYVIVVGFALFDRKDKKLFSYADPTKVLEYSENAVTSINAYLVEGTNVLIESRTKPLCDIEPMIFGNMANDGGNLILTEEEKSELLSKEPLAEKWIKLFIGSEELINNKKRYCLWLDGISPKELNILPLVKERVEAVHQFRSQSTREATQKLAEYPTLFGEIREGTRLNQICLVVPRVSSENREIIPMSYLENTVVSDRNQIIFNAPKWLFAILTSRMHMAWMRYTAGRLKWDYSYSKDIVYNNYPFPDVNDTQKDKLAQYAQDILDARAVYPDSSLADLYNPTTMPPNLRKAHNNLDSHVDKLYRKTAFKDDADRVALLLLKYQELSEQDMLIKTEIKKVRRLPRSKKEE